METNPFSPFIVDLYQFTMILAEYSINLQDFDCTAALFFRTLKYSSNYMIAGGINNALNYIKNWKITENDRLFLNKIYENHPEDARNMTIGRLMSLSIDQLTIQYVQDGSIVGPNQPFIQLKGPLALLQLLETPLLNIIGHPTLVATQAFLIKTIIRDKPLYEFGLRRAQGPGAGSCASIYAYIGGADATSNTCVSRYEIPCVGTMAHSYITYLQHSTLDGALEIFGKSPYLKLKNLRDNTVCENFLQYVLDVNNLTESCIETNVSELVAGAYFAASQPKNYAFLIDTYDSIKSGLENYCYVSNALIRLGYKPKGVRMDSGDLYEISVAIKNKFVEMSYAYPQYSDMKIIASNDLNIEKIRELEDRGAPIDIYAVGTNLVTGGDTSSLGCVYKILDVEGKDVMKLCTPEKAVLPGSKNIYRLIGSDSYCVADIIALESESIQDLIVGSGHENGHDIKQIICWNPKNLEESALVEFTSYEQLLKTITSKDLSNTDFVSNGQIEQCRMNCRNQMTLFSQDHLTNKVKYNFYISTGIKNRILELFEQNALK